MNHPSDYKCILIKHLSPEYWETVKLRYDILRLPLKIDFSYSQLLAEGNDFHIACYNENDDLKGCLILTAVNNKQIRMRQVAVAESAQKQGLGKAMVEFSEAFTKKKEFTEMILHARETAIPFYLKLGYELFDEPFTEVGIPHQKMRKSL